MNKRSLSYFKTVPGDFNAENMTSFEVDNGDIKPKYSIPISAIHTISPLSEEEMKKKPKFYDRQYPSMKIVFDKTKMVKGGVYPDENEDPHSDSEDSPRNSMLIPHKNQETWMFSLMYKTDEPRPKGATLQSWVSLDHLTCVAWKWGYVCHAQKFKFCPKPCS